VVNPLSPGRFLSSIAGLMPLAGKPVGNGDPLAFLMP
jgi:hypothetical protein